MSKIPTRSQVSAGGVAYRRQDDRIEVVLISVGERGRWQLPKGMIDESESIEAAAMREVREETGLETEMVRSIDKVEYWFYSKSGGRGTRFHKVVHFYLLYCLSGDVRDHDDEVNEARWFEISEAIEALTFPNEKNIVQQAAEMIVDL
jgi:8-oxo-dGTP pyrophosphatase MutT (NUDIX family)